MTRGRGALVAELSDAAGARAPKPIELTLTGITKSFGSVDVLRGVSITLRGPEIVGIIGPNGSGKSTLLGILSGSIAQDDGVVSINGAVRAPGPAHRSVALGVGRTFQIVRLGDNLRIWENIAAGMRGHARPRRSGLRTRVAELADMLHITAILDRWPDEVSAADLRRVEIARALAMNPIVLLMDEPAAGLSATDALSLVPVIKDIATRALVVVVEHNLQLMFSVASSVHLLVGGNFAVSGTPQSIVDSAMVREVYLGRHPANRDLGQ